MNFSLLVSNGKRQLCTQQHSFRARNLGFISQSYLVRSRLHVYPTDWVLRLSVVMSLSVQNVLWACGQTVHLRAKVTILTHDTWHPIGSRIRNWLAPKLTLTFV